MMMKRSILAVAALVCAAACGSSNYGSSSGATSTGGTTGNGAITVDAQSSRFSPATITVSPGQTVTWKNMDSIDHTVTSGTNGQPDGKFDHVLHPGDTFQFTFSQAGSYPYFCRYHFSMGMTGTVSVGSGSSTGGGGTSTSSTGGTSATSGGY